jgi:hypothetical protein
MESAPAFTLQPLKRAFRNLQPPIRGRVRKTLGADREMVFRKTTLKTFIVNASSQRARAQLPVVRTSSDPIESQTEIRPCCAMDAHQRVTVAERRVDPGSVGA